MTRIYISAAVFPLTADGVRVPEVLGTTFEDLGESLGLPLLQRRPARCPYVSLVTS